MGVQMISNMEQPRSYEFETGSGVFAEAGSFQTFSQSCGYLGFAVNSLTTNLRALTTRALMLQEAELVQRGIIIHRLVSSGGQGELYFATSSDGAPLAVKVIRKRRDKTGHVMPCQEANLVAEVEILASLHHPQHAKLVAFYESAEKYFLVTEYISGMDLHDYLTSGSHLSSKQVMDISLQLFNAVSHLHAQGIAHRDIKLENLMIQKSDTIEQNLVLIDFGFAQANTFCVPNCSIWPGTDFYKAPELIRKAKHYDMFAADVWACGVLLCALIFGEFPFRGQEMRQDILNKAPKCPSLGWLKTNPAMRRLILRCLNKNPGRRPTALQAKTELMRIMGVQPGVPATKARLSATDNKITRTVLPLFERVPQTQASEHAGLVMNKGMMERKSLLGS